MQSKHFPMMTSLPLFVCLQEGGGSRLSRKEENSMAAFDRVKSGIPQMDGILDYIRMGDNVV